MATRSPFLAPTDPLHYMPGKGKAMDRHDFINIMELAFTDAKTIDPETLGIAMIVLHRTPDGDVGAQIGSNMGGAGLLAMLHDLMDDVLPPK
jgi:hypothetical protein